VTDAVLAASLAEGPHALLATLVGEWAGATRTWFTPGELGDESETTGTVRAVLGGRFVVHRYRGSLVGEEMEVRPRSVSTSRGFASSVRGWTACTTEPRSCSRRESPA